MSTENINDYFKNTGIGSGVNRLKIEDDGTLHRTGAATTWDDLTNSLIGEKLSSNQGKVDYVYSENAVEFQSGGDITDDNDVVIFNMQYPHAAIEDGDMKLHIHWEQTDATAKEFTIEHRIQSNGSAKTTAWTQNVVSTASSIFTYTSGTMNQITPLVSVDMTDAGISAIVQCRLARTDSESGSILGTSVDAHIERDTDGSRSEYSK